MKTKRLFFLAGTILVLSFQTVFASSAKQHAVKPVTVNTKVMKLSQMKSTQKNTTFNLYAKPDQSSSILAKLKPFQRLVPIYQKKGWVKVGNPRNGDVGWINMKEYHQVITEANQSRIKSIYIKVSKAENGKDHQYIVEGYRNGKKMTARQAKAMYHRIEQQQHHQEVQMNRLFERSLHDMSRMENDMFLLQDTNWPLMRPVFIVVNPES